MDPSEAREHLELVEKIIAASSRKLEAGGEFFVAWGLASGAWCILVQLVLDGIVPTAALWLAVLFFGGAVIFSAVRGRYYRKGDGRMSVLQREFFNVLTLCMSMAFVSMLVGFRIFAQWGLGAIYTVAASIVLFYVGMHGNRRAIVAGILMVVSLAIANFVPAYTGYALAGGFIFGYAGFGVAELLARD